MEFSNNRNSMTCSGSSNRQTKIKAHSLDKNLTGILQKYFGIPLEKLPEMSDAELAQFADRAIDMKRLREVLPILEKHFTELIEGQIEYEGFVTRVQKSAAVSAKKIDQNTLETFLVGKGYQQHIGLMGQKARNGLALLQAENRSAISLEHLNFSTALQLVAMRHQRSAQNIQLKIPQAQRREQLAQQQREQRQQRKDLLAYGTAQTQSKNWWQGLGDWFSGRR